ncbi:Scr1 family TA system antitoxin-like transcriptional regulator [Streptomyces sp. NPDC057148]|uniref:Scr1 family TA system antitoxin-like transcriptional regulator n=1 Tax=unclassified Streptomyces TaxID=2593676 RepID=UPI00363E7733
MHEAAQRPNTGLRFLPFDAGAHAVGAGHFVSLGRGDEREPLSSMTAVYIETRRRGIHLDEADGVAAYKALPS